MAPHPPRPLVGSRIVAVDFGKGMAIIVMIIAHHLSRATSSVKAGNSNSIGGIINGVLQLMNGVFFMMAGIATYASMRKRLNEPNGANNIRKLIVMRGFLLIGLTITVTTFFMYLAEDVFFQEFRKTDLAQHSADLFRGAVWEPEVVAYIAFSTTVCGLIVLSIEQRSWSLRRKLYIIASMWVGIHVLSLLLRLLMDTATCGSSCIGDYCRTMYTAAQVAGVPASFPTACHTTYAKHADFSDNDAWTPCDGITAATPITSNATLSGWTPNLQHNARERCEDFVSTVSRGRNGVSFVHLSERARGMRWCPSNVSRDTLQPNAADLAVPMLEQCELIPWWAPPHQSSGRRVTTDSVWARTNDGQKFVNWLLWPWLGRYGFFSYGATTLIGYGIGITVFDETAGWTPRLFNFLYLLGLGMLIVGVYPALHLFLSGSVEGLEQASVPIRLFIGGLEVLAAAGLGHVMEGRPTSGCGACCRCCSCACCVGCCAANTTVKTGMFKTVRRFGMISWSIYTLHYFTIDIVNVTINAMGGFQAPWCAMWAWPRDGINATETPNACAASGSNKTNDALQLLYVVVHLLLWLAIVPLWHRCGFVGSLEWMTGTLTTKVHSTPSDVLVKMSDVRFVDIDETAEVSCEDACCNLFKRKGAKGMSYADADAERSTGGESAAYE